MTSARDLRAISRQRARYILGQIQYTVTAQKFVRGHGVDQS